MKNRVWNRIAAALLALSLTLTPLPAEAAEISSDGLDENHAALEDIERTAEDAVPPDGDDGTESDEPSSLAEGDEVTVIEEANNGSYVLTSDGVLTVKSNNFSGDNDGATVHHPVLAEKAIHAVVESNVTSIGQYAFRALTNLETVTIEGPVTSIGTHAFAKCSSLREITLPGSLQTISSYAFRDCTALDGIQLPAGVTGIGEYAFLNCASLTSVRIPDGVTEISTGLFSGCTNLSSVTIPDGVTSIGSYAFKMNANDEAGVCGKLASITLPDSIQKIGGSTFGGTAIETLTLPKSLQTVSASFQMMYALKELIIQDGSTSINAYIFGDGLPVEKIHIPESVTTISQNAFVGITGDFVIYGETGSYAETFANEHGIPFNGQLVTGRKFSVKVTDEAGTEIPSGYTVTWYDANGLVLGTGELSVTDKLPASFTVTLGEGLSGQYRQPERQAVQAGDTGDYAAEIALELISNVTVTGRVLLPDGTAAAGASVSFAQEGGNTVRAAADASGAFSASVRDVPTDMTVSLEGYYDRKLRILTGSGNPASLDLEDLSLTALPKSRIRLDLAVAPLEGSGDQPLTSFAGLTFTVTRNGAELRGVTAQYPYLLFEDGVQAEDRLTVAVTDTSGETRADPVTVTLNADRLGEASIRFTRSGAFTVSLRSGSSQATLMLFDSQGKLVRAANTAGQYTSPGLPDGNYQIAALRRTELLGSVPSLSEFAVLGLREGTDYAARRFTVSHGRLTDLGTIEVPELDESRLYYTEGGRTGASLTATTVPVAKLVTMRVEYALRGGYADSASGQYVTVELPEGLAIVGQPTLDSKVVSNYSIDNTSRTVRIPTDRSSGIVRFCLKANDPGQYSVTARLGFLLDGAARVQPVGSVRLTATDAEIYAADRTGTRNMVVSGTAAAGSTVTVYDNGQRVRGTAMANDAGNWQLNYTLPGQGNYELHTIYAEIRKESATATTGTVETVYDAGGRGVSRVTMYNTTHDTQRETVFDYHDPYSGLGYYILEDRKFTFRIEFDRGDAQLSNVRLKVFTETGEVYTYDTVEVADGVYTAAASHIVPVNVGVEYTCTPPGGFAYSVLSTAQGKEAAKEELQQASDAMADLLEVKEVFPGESETEATTIRMGVVGDDDGESRFDVVMTPLNYADYPQEVLTANRFVQVPGEASQYYLISLREDRSNLILVDTAERTATSVCIRLDLTYPDDPAAGSAQLLGVLDPPPPTGSQPMPFGGRLLMETMEKQPAIPILPSAMAATDLKYLRDMLDYRHKKLLRDIDNLREEFVRQQARECPDGTPKLDAEEIRYMEGMLNYLDVSEAGRYDYWKSMLGVYEQKIKNALAFDLVTLGFGKGLVKAGKIICENAPGYVKVTLKALENFDKVNDHITWWDSVLDYHGDQQGYDLPTQSDFWDLTDVYGSPYYFSILEAYNGAETTGGPGDATGVGMLTSDLYRFLACKEPEPEEPKDKSPVKDKDPVQDPSGYVYEAVPSNRLEGVTVTLYKQGENRIWNAEAYGQENPLTTGADGMYRWDVPEGNWQVKAEKSGYETYTTDWMEVPPPRTDVNIAMVSTAAPVVSSVIAYEDRAELVFSQYMDIGSVQAALSMTSGGAAVPCDVVPLDAEYDAEGTAQYATRFALVPTDGGTLTGPVTVTVNTEAKNYANTPIAAAYESAGLTPVRRPTGITAPESVQAALHENTPVSVTLAPGLAGRRLTVESLTPALVTVSPAEVTTGSEGAASVTVTGALPGVGQIRVTEPDSGLSVVIPVHIAMPGRSDGTPEPVTAHLDDGTAVTSGMILPSGTRIYLSTPTAGGTIRYTLDDTCPCTEAARVYTGPIVLTRDLVLRAAAVKDGQYSASPNLRLELTVQSGGSQGSTGFPGGTGNRPDSGSQGSKPGEEEEPGTPAENPAERPAALPFTDVTTGAWYYDAVEYVFRRGMMLGDGSSTRFNPEGTLTRAMVVTLLYRLEGEPAAQAAAFTDVAAGQWYTLSVGWAAANGIVEGYGGGTFGPDDEITREQLAAILYRYAGWKGYGTDARADLTPYSDADRISSYAVDAVRWAIAQGLITGMDGGALAPESNATRAQAAAILMRFCESAAGA